uniref:RING-type domain-containing protein n=1 Tax=Globisporangium ultimum (strain ATCC 200006 / CBS 805.95 / DAOM BR144) TaxID=431595 RepID=K3W9J9_GLOUD
MAERRVLAEGWGQQSKGSVFCADSSLRFIYEAHHDTAPAAITSLAASGTHHQLPAQPGKQQSFFMDQLKGTNASMNMYYANARFNGNASVYPVEDKNSGGVFAGKRPRESSMDATVSHRGADGVDLYEAEIARTCTVINRQVPSLPHSFRECSVCLSANAYAQIASCGHTFHSKCFLRWFRMNRSCPLCRGHVDKIQLAPVVSVQDELEAIMAEIDEEPLDVDASKSLVDPLMENPDFISFLESDFDTDMDMVALEDENPAGLSHDDVSMEMEDVGATLPQRHHYVTPKVEPHVINTSAIAAQPNPFLVVPTPASTPAPMQFAPSSTMPNYWNVLNQGLSYPAPAPMMNHAHHSHNHSHNHQSQQRMVHIAPKPDARALQSQLTQPSVSSTADLLNKTAVPSFQRAAVSPAAPRVVSCRCTGGCRNGRCACVKEGGMCGVSCRCTSCKNPFLMVKAAGADIDALLKDSCFMHNVSKTRDMVQRLQEPVNVPCCNKAIKVIDCVQGYSCTACHRGFDFSWCMNKLVDSEKTPRNHCDICKRCCDHRDVHCNDCGRCYFAGVATSLPCPCKEQSHKKRRENAENDSASGSSTTTSSAEKKSTGQEEEEGEGECCIM